ncbi:MAG: pilus assembly protein [Chloroflexi bacterium]|nr:pilus assembly protein [Chloroflexota bacterium]
MKLMRRTHRARRSESGQALVEFSLAIIPFLLLVMALFDLGRAVYTYNGLSEAAREIARVTAVYAGLPLGTTTETANRVAVQQALVPGMGTPTFECVTVDGSASSNDPCRSGDYVRVTLSTTYTPVSLLGLGGPINLSSSASIRIP